jgi:hypothetical protein
VADTFSVAALLTGGPTALLRWLLPADMVLLADAATEALTDTAAESLTAARGAATTISSGSSARIAAIRDALTDENKKLLSPVERQGVKFTIRRVEAQGYSLDGAIKYRGNQGIDLSFTGTGQNAGRFALAEAKVSSGLGSLKVDSLGIRQGSFDYFDTRLQRAGEFSLQQQLQMGNVDLFGGFQKSGRLFLFDPTIFQRNVNFITTPGAAILIP